MIKEFHGEENLPRRGFKVVASARNVPSGRYRVVDILVNALFRPFGQRDKGQSQLIAILADSTAETNRAQAADRRIVWQEKFQIEFRIQAGR